MYWNHGFETLQELQHSANLNSYCYEIFFNYFVFIFIDYLF